MDAVFVASRRFLQRIYVSQMRHALGTVVQDDHRAEGRDLPRGEDVAEVEEPGAGEDVGRRIERKKVFSEGGG